MPTEISDDWKGGHSRLLLLKRLAQAREGVSARGSTHQQRDNLGENIHNPSTGPARWTTRAGVKRLLSPSEDWLLDRGFIGSLDMVAVRLKSEGEGGASATARSRLRHGILIYPPRYEIKSSLGVILSNFELSPGDSRGELPHFCVSTTSSPTQIETPAFVLADAR